MTFKHLFPGGSIKCPHSSCCKLATTKYWNDGSMQYRQPRVIHDVKDVILLVSAVYMCEDRHKTLANDPRILKMLPKTMIPFIMLHRSGFSQDMIDLIMSFCHRGMNFYSIEAAIKDIRLKNYFRRKCMYESLVEHYRKSNTIEQEYKEFFDFKHTRMGLLPTDDSIKNCFLAKFLEDESFYIHSLQAINTGNSLSFDHTFKVAANIGHLRNDNKWVTQYDSVFFIMNSQNKIVSWQFTRGTSFKQVENLLRAVNQRAANQGNKIETIYIDNCCQWKGALCSIFGDDIRIKLDIFHAIQRVAKKLSKKHVLYSQCMLDLKLIFRRQDDQGSDRVKETPKIDELLLNLNNFLLKWRSLKDDNEQYILNVEAIHEIEKLKNHAEKGCLTEIEVGGGTNCNEAFHRHINTFFHKSRIGTLYAYALLMLLIYRFNNRDKSPPMDLRSMVTPLATTEVMGILPDDHKLHEDEELEEPANLESIQRILYISISQYLLADAIQKQTKSANIPFMYLPYMQSLKNLHGISVNTSSDRERHESRLRAVLQSWNFILEPVIADGNCFFTSVMLNLIHSHKNIIENTLGFQDLNHSVHDYIHKLRCMLVNELLGSNKEQYNVLGEESYESEAEKFLNDGHFASSLGDAMPLAIANALNCCIVIFRSTEGMPITYVTPHEPSTNVIFIAYTDCGPGHYDSVIFKEPLDISLSLDHREIKCRCGVNIKDHGYSSCKNSEEKHSKCKCLSAKQSCSSTCGCKGCQNPYGVRISLGKRKRQCHDWQKLDLSSSIDRRQALADGGWSMLESIIFVHVIDHLECNEADTSTKQVCLSFYNQLVDYAQLQQSSVILPSKSVLRKKSKNQFVSKIDHFLKEIHQFKLIY